MNNSNYNASMSKYYSLDFFNKRAGGARYYLDKMKSFLEEADEQQVQSIYLIIDFDAEEAEFKKWDEVSDNFTGLILELENYLNKVKARLEQYNQYVVDCSNTSQAQKLIIDIKDLSLQADNLLMTKHEIMLDGFSETWNVNLYNQQFYYDALNGKRFQVDRRLKELADLREPSRIYISSLSQKYQRIKSLFEE